MLKQRYQEKKNVLGSKAEITIVTPSDHMQPTLIFDRLWQQIADFEQHFSRFKTDSELSLFNARAGQWIPVSDAFMNILRNCLVFSEHTQGTFNPFILPALQRAGYAGSWPEPKSFNPQLDVRNDEVFPASSIELGVMSARIPENSALDFGGIGKGYMLDLTANMLDQCELSGYCVSLGGDVIWSGLDEKNRLWKIGVASPADDSTPIAYITPRDNKRYAVASSTVTKRKGNDWHHLIDPATSRPSSSSVVMSTVVAKDGTTADVFAKTYVINPEFIHKTSPQNILGIILQHQGGEISLNLDEASMIKLV